MGKYFDEIYPNATKLDSDFIVNETDVDIGNLNAKEQDIMFNDYYINMCGAVASVHCELKSARQIENALNNRTDTNCCKKVIYNITDVDERKYHWKKAMSFQIQFDISEGRTGMVRGEDRNWLICPDTINQLDMLGFIKRSPALR